MPTDISTTFAKGLTLFKAFDHAHARLTLAELSRRTGLDRASVRRLTLTLVQLGYVEKEDRYYRLTPKVLVLAGSFLRANQFGSLIQPILDRFSQSLGAEISMAVRDEIHAVYVAKSTLSTSAISFGFTIGSRLPLLHTAIGRMLLAEEDPEALTALLGTIPIEPHTPTSQTERPNIAAAIDLARQEGYAKVVAEFEPRIAGMAVPIQPLRGTYAVLGASASQSQLEDHSNHERFLQTLTRCALEINNSYPRD